MPLRPALQSTAARPPTQQRPRLPAAHPDLECEEGEQSFTPSRRDRHIRPRRYDGRRGSPTAAWSSHRSCWTTRQRRSGCGSSPRCGAYWRVLDIRQVDGHYEVDTMIILVENKGRSQDVDPSSVGVTVETAVI